MTNKNNMILIGPISAYAIAVEKFGYKGTMEDWYNDHFGQASEEMRTLERNVRAYAEAGLTYKNEARESEVSARQSAASVIAASDDAIEAANLAHISEQNVSQSEANVNTMLADTRTVRDAAIEAKEGAENARNGIESVQETVNMKVEEYREIQQEFDKELQEAKIVREDLVQKLQTGSVLSDALTEKISFGETLDVNLEKKIAQGTSLQQTLGENIGTAQQVSENLVVNTVSSVTEIQATGKAQIDAIKEAGGGIENALSNYFALRRNGKVFTTKIYKWETSSSSAGIKMNANENMICEPSVGRAEGRDDYAQYGLFQHFTCNFSVDENGFNHVDTLEGQTGFSKYGKVQVGEVTMSAWFGIEDTADAVLYHYSDSQTELTPHPMKESVNPDGTLSSFMIHAKYAAGEIDGVLYSSKGLTPANGCRATQARQKVSYTGLITYMRKLGKHYCGTTSWDLFYRQLMMIIKYATTHSQSVMAGCTSYNHQLMNLMEETGVSRVVLTTSQAAKYVVGSYVSIGDMGEETNKDRYNEYMHNLAYSVKILSIDPVDDTNSAIYVDTPENFNTTLTTCISTMPWHTGSTDAVSGSDGSLNSNTSGKCPYKIQGIETCIGAYEVLGNVVTDIVMGEDGNPVRDVYVCQDASTLSDAIATVRTSYQKAKAQVPPTAESWRYITKEVIDTDLSLMIPIGLEASSATGFADALYTDAENSGQRQWLTLGCTSSGDPAGLWLLRVSNSWSYAYWHIVSSVSPNGTRGEWQATAL